MVADGRTPLYTEGAMITFCGYPSASSEHRRDIVRQGSDHAAGSHTLILQITTRINGFQNQVSRSTDRSGAERQVASQ